MHDMQRQHTLAARQPKHQSVSLSEAAPEDLELLPDMHCSDKAQYLTKQEQARLRMM